MDDKVFLQAVGWKLWWLILNQNFVTMKEGS